jgi:diguanylate cyclase (GGDEF)-like protein/PAS domain S-box-containing protein
MTQQRYTGEQRDTVVDALLADPVARVVAVNDSGLIVPMPPGVPVREAATISGAASVLELVDPDDIVTVIDLWHEVRATGAASTYVRSLHDPSTPVTMHGIDARDRFGVLLAFLIGYRDVAPDDVARAHDALRPRVCVVRKNELACLVQVDETATRLLGWTAADYEGRRTLELIHPDDQQRAIANWMDLLQHPGAARRTRLRHRHDDGTWLWFEVTNRNLLSHPEYGCVLSEMVDIAEEMAVTQALQASDQLLRRLTEALPGGILQMDLMGRVVHRNARLVDVVGRDLTSVFELYEVMADPEPLREVLRAVRDRRVDDDLEIDVVAPGGVTRRVAVSIRGLHTESGGCTGTIQYLSDVTEAAQLREQLAHKATHDDLTGCLVRGAAIDRLEACLDALPDGSSDRPPDSASASGPAGASVAVLFIDLDGFKDVNDRLGHAAGDAMLREVGRRLLADIAAGGAVGRFGGDEFVVLRTDLASPEAAAAAADVLRERLQTPFEHAGDVLVPQASVGAAWTDVRTLADPLVARADAAMYRLKRSRPDRGSQLTASGRP